MAALGELEEAYRAARVDESFWQELSNLLTDYVGRPTPLYHAANLSQKLGVARGGPQIWLKREDLAHTGAHKINNAMGQILLAKRLGKKRIIAETGAGQHGVATATACAMMGLECIVYMGEEDIRRQAPNVYRMKLLGASVEPVLSGSRTLKRRHQRSHPRLGDQRPDNPLPHRQCRRLHTHTPCSSATSKMSSEKKPAPNASRQIGRLPDYAVACVWRRLKRHWTLQRIRG